MQNSELKSSFPKLWVIFRTIYSSFFSLLAAFKQQNRKYCHCQWKYPSLHFRHFAHTDKWFLSLRGHLWKSLLSWISCLIPEASFELLLPLQVWSWFLEPYLHVCPQWQVWVFGSWPCVLLWWHMLPKIARLTRQGTSLDQLSILIVVYYFSYANCKLYQQWPFCFLLNWWIKINSKGMSFAYSYTLTEWFPRPNN